MVSEFSFGSSVGAEVGAVASAKPSNPFRTDSCKAPENHNFIMWFIIMNTKKPNMKADITVFAKLKYMRTILLGKLFSGGNAPSAPPRGTKVPRCHGVASSSVAPTVEQPMVVPRVFALRANICSPLGPLLYFVFILITPTENKNETKRSYDLYIL